MTGSNQRILRACVGALSISLITGAIAQSAPQRSRSAAGVVRVAQAETPAAAPALDVEMDDDSTTLVLTPADDTPAEITGTLIMQLVSEVQEDAGGPALVSEKGRKVPSKAVQQALRLRGSRYRYGGTSRGGFDCSGFTRYVYARMGIALPHSSSAQFHCGRPVPRAQLKPGDLVFFGRGRRHIGHVGIYVGESRFVHASNPSRGVTVDSMGSPYYARTYRGARRVRGSAS